MAMHRTPRRRFFRRSRHARRPAEAPATPPAAAPAVADPRKVAVLRDKLRHSHKLDRVMSYFLESFGDDPGFMRLGAPMRNDDLKSMLGQVTSNMVGGDAKNLQAWFLQLPEHRMVHGMLLFESWTGISFYFEDLQMGLCALMDASLTGPSYYVRFSLKEIHEGPERSRATPQGQNVMV